MSSVNLTRSEAEARSRIVRPTHYTIELDLTGSESTFRSVTTVDMQVLEAGDTFIDLRDAHLRRVELDGQEITPRYSSDDGLALEGLTVGEHRLVVDADCRYSNSGQGLHRYTDPADGEVYLYTQFETADAKRMYACFDQPDMKATYRLTAVTPDSWKVITNGVVTTSNESEDAPSDAAKPGTVRHTADFPYPISTYIVAVCAGPYHEVRDTWRGKLIHHPETPVDQPHDLEIPLGLYCRASLAHALDADRILEETKQGFDFYHANFGVAYPFDKYDQVFVPEFNMGAMENAGCVTHRDEYVFDRAVTHYMYERRADTILHEMAHMWFGDLVTMRWWDDLWLNESFATWAAAISQAEATRYTTAWTTFAFIEKSWAYAQDVLPSTHPVYADAVDIEAAEQNFDGITYAKGASLLKQLQAYVGPDAFFAGVRLHFVRHAFGNATFADLLSALEEASGRDLSSWSSAWLTTTGVNTLHYDANINDGRYTSFAITQSGAQPGAGEMRTHRIGVGLYALSQADTAEGDAAEPELRCVKRCELDVSGERTEVPELVGEEVADLVIVNDQDLSYCLTELGAHTQEFLCENIHLLKDSMARALCWSAAWQATRNGVMRARDFLRLLQRGIRHEDQLAVLERVIGQAVTAVYKYGDPEWAESTGKSALASLLYESALDAAAPDAQLLLVNTLAKVEFGEHEAEFFQRIVDGDSPLEGLTVDSNLRWLALTALIARGSITPDKAKDVIAETLDRDKSATTQKAAWAATAAIPTAEAKRTAWETITTRASTVSNLEIRHALEGFRWAGSATLLKEFDSGFYDLAEKLWEELSSETALQALPGIYPDWDYSSARNERDEDFMGRDLAPALRRLAGELVDTARRADRARAFDGGRDTDGD